MKENLSDIIEPKIKFELDESASEVDGQNVLAKVKGQFFVPNGKSRNGRFYTKKLWEKVFSDPVVNERLKKRVMFGTVGHDQELNDKAVREGQVSHFMVSGDPETGMGEALILNTPVGKILNTMLRAGSQLYVSSRANGTFSGKVQGLPKVDEDTYDLDGWDFVIEPGFLEANPKIAESLEKIQNDLKTQNDELSNEEGSMNEELIKHITNENAELKNKVSDLTDEAAALQEDKKSLSDENEHLKGEVGKLEEANKTIEAYSEFGTPEEIKEKLEKKDEDSKVLESFQELADTPEDAKTALTKALDFIKEVSEEFGTIEEIREALTVSSEYKEKMDAIGTPEEIEEALTQYSSILEEREADKKAKEAKELAEELGISEEKVKELLDEHTVEQVKKMYSAIKENMSDDDSSRWRKKSFNEDKNDDNEDEDVSESKILGTSRIARINERFSK